MMTVTVNIVDTSGRLFSRGILKLSYIYIRVDTSGYEWKAFLPRNTEAVDIVDGQKPGFQQYGRGEYEMNRRGTLTRDTMPETTDILTGQLTNLAPLPSKTVKIFVCANPEEFDDERKSMWHEIVPDLQHHCLQYGIDVDFVDMLLGVGVAGFCTADDLDASISAIDTCHAESAGPFFLCLLGDDYGKVPLPSSLKETEFNNLCDAARDLGKDVSLLEECYHRDDNSITPVYRLSQHFEQNKQLQNNWLNTYKELLEIMQKAVLKRPQVFNLEKFFLSGLERQIRHAIWFSSDMCLFVFRSSESTDISNGYDVISSPSSSANNKPTDANKPSVKFEKSALQAKLKDDILTKVDETNILRLKYPGSGQSAVNKRKRSDYIDSFIIAMECILIEIIDKCMKGSPVQPETPRALFDYNEALLHLNHCVEISTKSGVTGFEKPLSQLQALLINGARTDHQLAIIKGPEGSGKTTVVAKTCFRSRELFGKEAIIIPVFIGLTTRSCFIEDVFRSVCSQINIIFDQECNIETYTLKKLTNYFHGLMNRVSKSSKHMIIFLDGLERLHTDNETNFESIDWLAAKLPPKVHIVISCCSSEKVPSLKRLESKLLNTDVIVKLSEIPEDDCRAILSQTISSSSKRLSAKHQNLLVNSMINDRFALVVHVVSTLASEWTSEFLSKHENIINNVAASFEELVEYILTELELKHGKRVTSALCSYIALSHYGLTEVELQDAMATNDEVLLSAYAYTQPIALRFPSHIWIAMKSALDPLLGRRFVAGKRLLTWRNKLCSSIIRQRYLDTAEEALHIHRDLADIFLEHTHTNNPFVTTDSNELVSDEYERPLCPQPIVYSDILYNMRKLQELWYHLLNSGNIEKFKEHTFCNFEYLLAMADANSIQKVMYNVQLVKSLLVDADVHLLDQALRAADFALHMFPIQLANELIGRLRQLKDFFPNYIDQLVTQCMEWCDSFTYPLLVPLTTWLDNVHVPLITSVTNMEAISCAALMPNGQHILLAKNNSICMYHIATQRQVKSFKGHSARVTCVYLNTNNWSMISGAKDKTMCLWDLNSEECIETFRDFKTYVTCLTCLDDKQVISGTEDGSIVVRTLDDGHVVKTLVMHWKRVTALRVCKSKTILVSCSLDSKIVVWYTSDWRHMNVIDEEYISPVLCIDISADSTFLVAGCDNGAIHVIAMATGTVAQNIQAHKGQINSLAICHDCHHCVAASSSGEVYLYNFRTGEVLDVLTEHTNDVLVALLAENQQLAITVSENEVCVWSLLKRYSKETYQDVHSGPVTCLAMTSDGKRLISGGVDGLLKTWNLDISDFADNFIGHSGPVTCLSLADDNSFMASGSTDTTVKVWNLVMVTVSTNYKGHEQSVNGVYVMSDCRLVLSMDASQKIHMWRAEDGQTIRLYAGPTLVHTVAPNSQHCVSGGGDNRLQIWKLSDGSVVKEINHTDKITCFVCSRDSRHLITGSMDRSVKVWELATGKIEQIIVDHSSSVRCLAVTEDNETILSGCDDGIIYVCSVTLGTNDKKMYGHFDQVTVLKLTGDDSILISGCLDNTVRVWNYRRCTQLALLDTHYPVRKLVITETAERISTLLADNCNVPIMCLHNTPSRPKPLPTIVEPAAALAAARRASIRIELGKNNSDTQIESSDISSDSHVLPIKPRLPAKGRLSMAFVPPVRNRRQSSVSSIPQIIKHSPIKAPIQTTVKAQEKRRLKFPLQRKTKPKSKTEETKTKRSSVCNVL